MDYYKQAEYNKKQLDKKRPLVDENLKEFKEYYRIGLTYSSNAIEGNTLTESETKILLEDGLTVGGKPIKDCYEAIGHSNAYDFMFSLTKNKGISVSDISNLHRLFYKQIDEQNAGKFRKHNVIVTGTQFVFPNYSDVPNEMNNFVSWWNSNENKLNPIKFAALVHLKFVTIHPFVDGNGRTARLLMNLVLIRTGYEVAVIPPICRSEYLDAIRVAQNKGNNDKFCDFIAERVVENQKDMMRMLHIPYHSISKESFR